MEMIKKQDPEQLTQNTAGTCAASVPEHGGGIDRISEETGIPTDRLIDFSASINPLGVPDTVKEVINSELDNLVNYPDPDAKLLRHKIARRHGVDPETVLCGNGSTELIYLIPRALKPSAVLIPSPTFSEYERACNLSNELRVMSYELRKGNNFKIVPEEFIAAMAGEQTCIAEYQDHSSLITHHSSLPCMAFLCNPNNPTGTLLCRDEVLAVAGAARKDGCLLVVDEAFIDFTPEESVIRDVQDNPCLIVLRSMTKFYALTGLRAGYGIFHPDLIKAVRRFKEPWTVNHLAQKAAIAALDDSEYADRTFKLMTAEKKFMEKCFQEMDVEYVRSAANYYLLKVADAGIVVKELRGRGILVRDCSNFKGLDGPYIRVAVKSHAQNELLIKELKELCRA